MQHARFDEAAARSHPLTQAVRETLAGIVAGLDARFMAVGTALAQAVETIDHVVGGLDEVGHAFEGGEAGIAVDNLGQVARRLSAVPDQQAQRGTEIASIRSISAALQRHVAEVGKALEALKIYGVNVKIAASGAEDFVDFADRMHGQLVAGEIQIKGFIVKLVELEASLVGMERSDQLLKLECAKVVPEVPDRLLNDAAMLRERQMKLAALAGEVSEIARSIQANVAAVLCAIQIGDIARQRLEHVLAGCAMLDAYLAQPGCLDAPAVQYHMLRLFAAQLSDSAADFARETQQLIQSIRKIGPQASRLLTFQEGDNSAADSPTLLRQVEAGIAEADVMTLKLRDADRQAEAIIDLVLDTVDDLTVRAGKVRDLRIDVQHMAINIGLRCRRMESIGRPVAVIANEIRSYSTVLDGEIQGIVAAAAQLGTVSVAMRDRGHEAQFDSGEALAQSLSTIGEGARRTEKAMDAVGAEAAGIVDMLRAMGDQLSATLDLGETIETMGTTLGALAGPETDFPAGLDHPIRDLLAQLHRSYTMAREREIHGQFAPAAGGSVADDAPQLLKPNDDDDDDGLFDALF